MSKGIRLGSKTAIKVEVNDKGETIRIDLGNPDFIKNAQIAAKEIESYEKEFKEIDEFFNKEDIEASDLLDDDSYKFGEAISDYYANCRVSVDRFLGTGACKKIFGDDNYYEMFNELWDVLKPYLDKAEELANQHYKEMNSKREKYITKSSSENVI